MGAANQKMKYLPKLRIAWLSLIGMVAHNHLHASIVLAGAAPPVAADASVPSQPWFPQAPPLPAPADTALHVATVDELFLAVDKVRPGGSVLLADGHYRLPRTLVLKTGRMSLRSASGRRDAVILDGAPNNLGELVAVTGCSSVTVADLTIQNATWNGFKINADSGVHDVAIYNCVIHNIWQRGVKGVPGVVKDGRRLPCRTCRVQYCLFYNDRPKRLADDPYEQRNPRQFGGNYIAGMDVMNAEGWLVSDNVFLGIHGLTGEARGAVFFWNQSSSCVIERNIILDCDTGIYLGSSMRQPDTKVHCTGFVVRNNFVARCPEGAITAIYTRDCKIVHNTIHDPTNKLRRSIRIVHDSDGLVIANNLCSGPNISVSDDAGRVEVRDNLERVLTDAFVDPAKGNLHLSREAAETISRGTRLPDAPEDVDRRPRGPKPTVGAHELGTPGGRE
jgi:hypothetical protein